MSLILGNVIKLSFSRRLPFNSRQHINKSNAIAWFLDYIPRVKIHNHSHWIQALHPLRAIFCLTKIQ